MASENEYEWEQVHPDIPAEIVAVVNAARMVHLSGRVPDCCYQLSESMAFVLRNLGYTDAHACACDVYGWNADFIKAKRGEIPAGQEYPDAKRRKRKSSWEQKQHPQRKGVKPRTHKKRYDPYSVSMYHEQVVDGDGYDGHVVCIVDGWVLDATFHQFSRPKRAMKYPMVAGVPLAMFMPMPDGMLTNGWCEPTFFAPTSVAQNLIAWSLDDESHRSGNIALCLRPDIESDNWMRQTPTTQANIESSSMLLQRVVGDVLNQGTEGQVEL